MIRSSAAAAAGRALAVAVVLGCCAALVAACGNSNGTTASSGASATATTQPSVNPGGTPVSVSPSPAATTPSGPAPCATSALKVTVSTSGGGAAAGSTYYPLQFVNTSSSSCTLYGYPGVSFVTAQGGSQIGPAATRNPVTPKQLVTVAPGQTVHAELQVVDAGNYPPADCGMVTAHWLKIFPPNQTAPLYVSFSAQTCTKAKQILTVQTVQAGASGT
ncbi:MAG TPA: DUF4232 domain-containing protein [Streptosporangiaceae bacterium]|nr:DUF4232 domain-containing protein [Streptosporangiaceae bacterium]